MAIVMGYVTTHTKAYVTGDNVQALKSIKRKMAEAAGAALVRELLKEKNDDIWSVTDNDGAESFTVLLEVIVEA